MGSICTGRTELQRIRTSGSHQKESTETISPSGRRTFRFFKQKMINTFYTAII